MEITYLTQEGYDKLKSELEYLKSHERIEIAKQIQEAREKGDLSENAEYDAAKDAQGLLELKISKLETLLTNCRVVDTSNIDPDTVFILSKVKIKNVQTNKEVTYQLVAEQEADLKIGKISIKSPVGVALLGKKVGEIAQINVPAGVMNFEILEITR
ncbi:MAG: transcription elongation factor GreA [Bacteroidia bacterium]|nr:transcription elongation factor GreA [Bacteroidia bacterium]